MRACFLMQRDCDKESGGRKKETKGTFRSTFSLSSMRQYSSVYLFIHAFRLECLLQFCRNIKAANRHHTCSPHEQRRAQRMAMLKVSSWVTRWCRVRCVVVAAHRVQYALQRLLRDLYGRPLRGQDILYVYHGPHIFVWYVINSLVAPASPPYSGRCRMRYGTTKSQ